MIDTDLARIVAVLLAHYPTAQGIYLFGCHAAGTAWPNSDVLPALERGAARDADILRRDRAGRR